MAFNYANEADIAMLLAEVRKYVPFYAGCSTVASTAAKEINNLTGFSLRTGATIRVKFANSNTAQNPTLNVNNTGAKSIYKYGSSSAGITAGSSWESGAVVTLTYDGTAWIMNDWIDAEFSVMTGATSSTAGTSGLVPAPAAGSQEKYLKGDGTWGNPGGSRPIAYQLDTVTGTGGAYTHTTTDLPVTATMKATGIEVSDTTVFGGQITVTVNDGSITLSCPEVNGTSSVTVSVMQAGDAASGGQTVTSEEFDILSNRIGTMSTLTTQTKTTVVGAVNEINQNVNNKVDRSDYDATKIPLSGTDSTSVKQTLTNVDADIEKTQSGLAVIVDGDTCSAPVPADGYAYIKSNTHGLANGLYKNISGSAFPVSGGIADNTVFSEVPDGGLNDLKNKMGAVGATDLQSQITTLNSKFTYEAVSDFNDFAPSGTSVVRRYGYSTGGSAINAPVLGDNITYRGYSEGVATCYTQHFTIEYANSVNNRGRSFIRTYLGSSFEPWREITIADTIKAVQPNAPITFSLALYGRAIVTLIGYSSTTTGRCFAVRGDGGNAIIKWLGEAPSKISITMNTSGVFTVTNSGDAVTYMKIEHQM